MQVPNQLKGALYSSSRISRCPRQSICLISKKCQNYCRFNPQCKLCELRCGLSKDIGGVLPEGEFIPDLQDAIREVEKSAIRSMSHPDMYASTPEGLDCAEKESRLTRAMDLLSTFTSGNPNGEAFSIEEKTVWAYIDGMQDKLGRL